MQHPHVLCAVSFFFNDTATPEIYTLSLHDALPIYRPRQRGGRPAWPAGGTHSDRAVAALGVTLGRERLRRARPAVFGDAPKVESRASSEAARHGHKGYC